MDGWHHTQTLDTPCSEADRSRIDLRGTIASVSCRFLRKCGEERLCFIQLQSRPTTDTGDVDDSNREHLLVIAVGAAAMDKFLAAEGHNAILRNVCAFQDMKDPADCRRHNDQTPISYALFDDASIAEIEGEPTTHAIGMRLSVDGIVTDVFSVCCCCCCCCYLCCHTLPLLRKRSFSSTGTSS